MGTPSSQDFEIYNPNNLLILEKGTTEARTTNNTPTNQNTPSAVPLLSNLALFMLAWMLFYIVIIHFRKFSRG